jgi:uncharacterized membrane-anchored protein
MTNSMSQGIMSWVDKHSTVVSLIIVVIYLFLRLTGYVTPIDYKFNYIASHSDDSTVRAYIFMRSVVMVLAIIFLGVLVFKLK